MRALLLKCNVESDFLPLTRWSTASALRSVRCGFGDSKVGEEDPPVVVRF
jgi:hypothetical protein